MKLIKKYLINNFKLFILNLTILLLYSCCDHTYRIKIHEKHVDSIKLYKSVYVETDYESKHITKLIRKITNTDSINSIIEIIQNSCDYNEKLFHQGMPEVYYTIEISDTTLMRIHVKEYSNIELLFYGDDNYYLPKKLKALFQ